MTRTAKIALAAILLGFLLFEGPNNPFAFVPPYIGLPAPLELLCCIAVSGAICYAVDSSWSSASPAWPYGTSHARGARAVVVACICGLAAYFTCSFAAVTLHYLVGFGSAIALAYSFLVASVIGGAEAVRRRLSAQ